MISELRRRSLTSCWSHARRSASFRTARTRVSIPPAALARLCVLAWGFPADAFVVLSFGQIRRYKELTLLLDAFEQAHIEGGVLLIVGLPLDEDETQRLEAISRNATNVVTILEFVPDNCVAELFAASDVFGSARLDGGTSGALVLALSLAITMLAAKCPAYDDLTDHGEAGWLFAPGTKDSLASALRSAATDSVGREAKARRALQRAACLRRPRSRLARRWCYAVTD